MSNYADASKNTSRHDELKLSKGGTNWNIRDLGANWKESNLIMNVQCCGERLPQLIHENVVQMSTNSYNREITN